MKLDKDKIIFESRREIEAIESALNQFVEEHPNDDDNNTVLGLCDLLEAMHRFW